MTKPTTFQRNTIKVAYRALRNKSGSRRFLVADEAGLGKTIVAQCIIKDFRDIRRRSKHKINVIYVCSNLSIAKQNQDRLLGFLSKRARQFAAIEQDRLSLTLLQTPAHQRTKDRLHLYAVTPNTSQLTIRQRGSGYRGTAKERALCFHLINRALGYTIRGLRRALALKIKSFKHEVQTIKEDADNINLSTVEAFKHALRRSLKIQGNQKLASRIKRFLKEKNAAEVVRHIRLALVQVALATINPELVIFDEFQRFDELIGSDRPADKNSYEAEEEEDTGFREAASRLLESLTGAGGKRALLLLSATPWIPYRNRKERGNQPTDPSEGFFQVVKFLHGGAGAAEVDKLRALLRERRELLIADSLSWEKLERNRHEIEAVLSPIMSRTERPRREGTGREPPPQIPAALNFSDLEQFKRFYECVEKGKRRRLASGHEIKRDRDLEMLVPLWNSVPLPMQSLGPKYAVWKRARKLVSAAAMDRKHISRLMPQDYPHPRLRALIEHMEPANLALPWVVPSHEWWPLQNGWKRSPSHQLTTTPSIDGKLLVFARFRAVVPAVAGLLSYHVESSCRGNVRNRDRAYERDGDAKLIRADSESSLELFHPSPLLIEGDPIDGVFKVSNIEEARAKTKKTLRDYLEKNSIEITHGARSSVGAWKLIAGLEATLGHWRATYEAWRAIGLHKNLPEEPTQIRSVNEAELEELARLAIGAPGAVLGRAVQRHWNKALSDQNFGYLVRASWHLQSRFDQPWIARTLKGPKETFAEAIKRAVLDRNLESTLDEHFWFLKAASPSPQSFEDIIQDFEKSVGLRTSSVGLHYGYEKFHRPQLKIRCHVATIFSRAEPSDEENIRPDEVRRAFNSPFWPHVLVTTSIGQEGLDFHPWCRTLLHWDPPPGPVAMEQREGRVDRYASLAIRRTIAEHIRKSNIQMSRRSPWEMLAGYAVKDVKDTSGLEPWWIYRSAQPTNLYFEIANSEISRRWNEAHEERGHYRLVLGMPNQNDLLGELKDMGTWDSEKLRKACLDLSPRELPFP
jgi:hypothetical protein